MLALVRTLGAAPGRFERGRRHDLDVVAVRIRRGVEVAGVVAGAPVERLEHAIDGAGIDERAVRGDLENDVGARLERRLEVAVEEIGRVSAHDAVPVALAERDDRRVVHRRRRGDDEVERGPRGRHALQHPNEQRLAGEREEHLPR